MAERNNPEFGRRVDAITLHERLTTQLPTAEIERLNVEMAKTHPNLTLDGFIRLPDVPDEFTL